HSAASSTNNPRAVDATTSPAFVRKLPNAFMLSLRSHRSGAPLEHIRVSDARCGCLLPCTMFVSEGPISIRFELILVILFQCRILLLLAQQTIAGHKQLDVVAHEATKCILRRAHDRFAAHIEACVYQHWTARFGLESFNQCMKSWIGIEVYRLNAR